MEATHLYDIATEESVISGIIGIPGVFDEFRNRLDVESFYSESCKTIWSAVCWAFAQNKTPDLPYLQAFFRDRSRSEDLEQLNRIAETPVSSDISQMVDILDERRRRRLYHDLRVRLQKNEAGDSGELDKIIQDTIEARDKFIASNVLDKVGIMYHAANIINENLVSDKSSKTIMTGFRLLDDMGGLPPETEVIIAAFSSQGKTAFAMSILNHAMKNGVKCAIYSAEMGASSIAGRLLNMMGWNVPITKFKTQQLLGATIEDFNKLSGQFIERPGDIFLDSSSNNNVDYICSSIRILHRKHGVQLVMVDYLQIIALYGDEGNSDQEKLAIASRKLQALAKQLNICIMVLSQFSRPARDQGHQPSEDLIRGSGQIYEACDIALYVYRPEKWENETYPPPFQDAEKKGTAMIKIGKYRDGESGKSAIVGFDGPSTLFCDFKPGKYDEDANKNYPKASAPTDTPEDTAKKIPTPKNDNKEESLNEDLPF